MVALLLERIPLEPSRIRYECPISFPGASTVDVKALISGFELADDASGNAAVLTFFAQRETITVLTFRSMSGVVRTLEIEIALLDPAPSSSTALITLSRPFDVAGWLQVLFIAQLVHD